jgi:hypothetical protein
MAKGDDVEERLIDFAVRVINQSARRPVQNSQFAGHHSQPEGRRVCTQQIC